MDGCESYYIKLPYGGKQVNFNVKDSILTVMHTKVYTTTPSFTTTSEKQSRICTLNIAMQIRNCFSKRTVVCMTIYSEVICNMYIYHTAKILMGVTSVNQIPFTNFLPKNPYSYPLSIKN